MPGVPGNPLKKLSEASSFWAGAVAACIERGYDANQARSVLVKCAQTDPALVHEFNQIAAALDEETASAPYPVMEKAGQEPTAKVDDLGPVPLVDADPAALFVAARNRRIERAENRARLARHGINPSKRPWMQGASDVQLVLDKVQREAAQKSDAYFSTQLARQLDPDYDKKVELLKRKQTAKDLQKRPSPSSSILAPWARMPGETKRNMALSFSEPDPVTGRYRTHPYGWLGPIQQGMSRFGHFTGGTLGMPVSAAAAGLGHLGGFAATPFSDEVSAFGHGFGNAAWEYGGRAREDAGQGLYDLFGGREYTSGLDWKPEESGHRLKWRHKILRQTNAPDSMYTWGDVAEMVGDASSSAAATMGVPAGVLGVARSVPAAIRAGTAATGFAGRVGAPIAVLGRGLSSAYRMGRLGLPVVRADVPGSTIPMMGNVGADLTRSQLGVAVLLESTMGWFPAKEEISQQGLHSYDEATAQVMSEYAREQAENHKHPWWGGRNGARVYTMPVKQQFLWNMQMDPTDTSPLAERIAAKMVGRPDLLLEIETSAIKAREQRMNIPMDDGYFKHRWREAPAADNPSMSQDYAAVLRSLVTAKRMHNRMLRSNASAGVAGATRSELLRTLPESSELRQQLQDRISGRMTPAEASEYLVTYLDPVNAPLPWGAGAPLKEGEQYSTRGRPWVPLEEEVTKSLMDVLTSETYHPVLEVDPGVGKAYEDMRSERLSAAVIREEPLYRQAQKARTSQRLQKALDKSKVPAGAPAPASLAYDSVSGKYAVPAAAPYISPVLDIPVSTEY